MYKIIITFIKYDYFCSLKKENKIVVFNEYYNNSEIFENDGGLDLIRIIYTYSLGGSTYPTIHVN